MKPEAYSLIDLNESASKMRKTCESKIAAKTRKLLIGKLLKRAEVLRRKQSWILRGL